ncbi:MAG: MoxR family ATPase [Lachnospiraceae bacterium]|nr:MoxR family ATPase [Lachnospiraceae bacterium]
MIKKLKEIINEYFIGNEEVTNNLLICLLAGGHVLLEDVPGVGKTTLAKTLSKAVSLDFGRIQFTPDTLPSDVTGVSVLNMKTGEFEYREGAIMHQMILADEINRTSPKTQASLLEAMAEGRVTVDGRVTELPKPFMVIATQNPVEFVGTYPLPEAQMDRFMMKLSIGYPKPEDEINLTKNQLEGKTFENIESVLSADDILKMREEVSKVKIVDSVLKYANDIINLTRQEKRFVMGASPRAMILLVKAAQARAFLEGRDFVTPDDVKAVSVNVLHHRLALTYEAKIAKENVESIIYTNVLKAKVPMV